MKKWLRRFKWSFALYNLFHRKALVHNVPAYKKLGLKKTYFSPVSSKDFRHLPPTPAVDHKRNLEQSAGFHSLPAQDRESLLAFDNNGYAILKHFLPAAKVDAINSEIENLLAAGKVKKAQQNKIMFAIHHSKLLRAVGEDQVLNDILSCLLHAKPVLFQSINFMHGSEQPSHSDSIHMTTYPLGGLLGVWIALEDISTENGPLHYYPGSHRLPYYLNADYDNEGNFLLTGSKSYEAYEEMIREKLVEHGLEKKVFHAQKGDVLIWHANLVHGGEPHRNREKTRKSMVLHYFSEGAICYHEITQRPALIKRS